MTNQPKQDAIVSQRTREAAADLMQAMPFGGLVGSADVQEGGNDEHYFVKAFARFQAEIEAATIERCAGVCDERVETLRGFGRPTQERAREADMIRERIRNLKGQTS